MSKVLNFSEYPDFKSVLKIYYILSAAHFRVYLAGGCVRDALLGKVPRDFDIATNALPEQVEALFPKTKPIGKAFGVILVIEDGVEVEVTTFRTDGGYQDSRRPDSVKFLNSENTEDAAREDAIRRDFSVNALFYDLNKDEVVDFVDGLKDLNNKIIRAVGDPEKRFTEDHLRILRAVRFIGQLGFKMEEQTRLAVAKLAPLVKDVSGERLHAELDRLLEGENVQEALEDMLALGLMKVIFDPSRPDAFALPDFNKTKKSLQRWGLLFIWLYKNADKNTEVIDLDSILIRLRFSNSVKSDLKKILYWTLQPDNFEKKSLGELIDHSFDENSYFGMCEFIANAEVGIANQEKFKKVQARRLFYNGKRPIPQVTAQQLKAQGFSGLDLGSNLKELYWKQLVG